MISETSEEFMKTNAMEKTKEEELSEWVFAVMQQKKSVTPQEYPWVSMDPTGLAYASRCKPRANLDRSVWFCGDESDVFVPLANVPYALRLWPWDEFLLNLVGDLDGRLADEIDDGNECEKSALIALSSPPISRSPALPHPAFQREVWAADVMSEAYRITVAIVEEPLPSPQEVPHWRLPTDEELDRLLPGGWTERCPIEV